MWAGTKCNEDPEAERIGLLLTGSFKTGTLCANSHENIAIPMTYSSPKRNQKELTGSLLLVSYGVGFMFFQSRNLFLATLIPSLIHFFNSSVPATFKVGAFVEGFFFDDIRG